MLKCQSEQLENYYPKAVDCWSLGIILYMSIFNRFPYTADQHVNRALWQKLVQHENWSFPGDVSDKTAPIIRSLLRIDALHRANSFTVKNLLARGSENFYSNIVTVKT